jgi:phytoene dehydrogenase-like protein
MHDTIIIGRDLSSLVAALSSSRHGLKTVLIAEGGQEAEHRDAGYAFPIDPTPLSGFGEDQTVLHLLKELNLEPDEAPKPLLMNPAVQILLSNHRIDLFHDREQLILEMIREFPQNEQEIRRFYHSADKACALIESWISEDHAVHRRRLGKILRGLLRLPAAFAAQFSLESDRRGDSRAFRRVIEAQLTILSHLYIDSARFPFSAAYLLSLPQKGVYYPFGGRIAWINWLRKRFTEAGGILMDECSVMRIDTKPEIAIDIIHSGTSTTLRGKRLIVSAQWEKLKSLLIQKKIFRGLVQRLDLLRPIAYPFSLHLGVRAGALPERLAPYAVWVQDETKPATEHNLVFIETSYPGEKERAPEGKRALCATVFLKKSPMMLTDQELSGVARSIIDSLEGLLPFLRESIDYVNIEKSISLSRSCQEIINQKYHPQKGLISGINTLSPVTPLHNVFLTGGILQAGLGFEGEILAGMDAAFLAGREIKNDGL